MTAARRAIGFGLLSLLLGGAAASGMSERERSLKEQIGEPVPVLVASRPIDSGSRIQSERLGLRQVPRRWAPPGALARPDQVAGMIATVAIPAGSWISAGMWRDPDSDRTAGLAADERVATVVASAPPDSVRPGSRVDVVIARAGSPPALVLRAAEVLSVRGPSDQSSGTDGGHRVEADLRTKVSGALRLAEAAGSGSDIRLLPIGGER